MSAPTPYFADDHVALYHGDFRDLAPLVLDGREPDLTMADPPYGETALEWDRWPDGWPSLAPGRSLWCFGSMRMFLMRGHEFPSGGWKFSQDVVWEKNTGSTFVRDRFRRVHECATHWYRGDWGSVHHETPRTVWDGPNRGRAVLKSQQPKHTGSVNGVSWEDDGTRLARSVLFVRNQHGRAINETEKPTGIVSPLVEYGCPVDGLVVDLFAGSCSTLLAARTAGRRAIGFEMRESQCESAARRLSQGDLFAGSA